MVARGVSLAKPRGSNSPTGARLPGNPYANADSSGCQLTSLTAVETRPVDWGANAAAELSRVARMTEFMMNFG